MALYIVRHGDRGQSAFGNLIFHEFFRSYDRRKISLSVSIRLVLHVGFEAVELAIASVKSDLKQARP